MNFVHYPNITVPISGIVAMSVFVSDRGEVVKDITVMVYQSGATVAKVLIEMPLADAQAVLRDAVHVAMLLGK